LASAEGDGSREVLDTSFANVPPEIRELRVRADAGFGFNPVLVALEERPAQYAVVARLTPAFKRLLSGVSYEPVNSKWEMTEFEHRPHGWPKARRFVVARRFIQQEEAETTLFAMGRYIYRAWVTNLPLTPAGIWHFYDGRAGMEPRICELREDFALRKIPTASFAANALYLEIVRLAYNLVTAFQRNCLDEPWQNLTLQKLRYKLFLIPGKLTRPQNRPVLRLRPSPMIESLAETILARAARFEAPSALKPRFHAGSKCQTAEVHPHHRHSQDLAMLLDGGAAGHTHASPEGVVRTVPAIRYRVLRRPCASTPRHVAGVEQRRDRCNPFGSPRRRVLSDSIPTA